MTNYEIDKKNIMKDFEEFKDEILRRAKAARACIEQYKRAIESSTFEELMQVIKDNFEWCCYKKIIDEKLIVDYKYEFNSNDIYLNESRDSGYLLVTKHVDKIGGNCEAAIIGNAVVNEVFDNAKIYEVNDKAVIERVSDNAKIYDVFNNAVINCVYGNAVINCVYDNVMIEHVYDNAVINCVYGNAVINCVYDNAMIEYVYDNAVINCVYDNAMIEHVFENAVIKDVSGNAKIINDYR